MPDNDNLQVAIVLATIASAVASIFCALGGALDVAVYLVLLAILGVLMT